MSTIFISAAFIREKVTKVYTFGSPLVILCNGSNALSKMGLPETIVHAFVQPWDPFARLFSEIDPLTPIFRDFGQDGATPTNIKCPLLQTIARHFLLGWEDLSKFKKAFVTTMDCCYHPIGVQHIMLPSPSRYFVDKTVTLNLGVPRIAKILTVSSTELLPALNTHFPLDPSCISVLPGLLRSLLHHSPDSYKAPIGDYLEKQTRTKTTQPLNSKARKRAYLRYMMDMDIASNHQVQCMYRLVEH